MGPGHQQIVAGVGGIPHPWAASLQISHERATRAMVQDEGLGKREFDMGGCWMCWFFFFLGACNLSGIVVGLLFLDSTIPPHSLSSRKTPIQPPHSFVHHPSPPPTHPHNLWQGIILFWQLFNWSSVIPLDLLLCSHKKKPHVPFLYECILAFAFGLI